jgi:arylsulfatase A-like enzyme
MSAKTKRRDFLKMTGACVTGAVLSGFQNMAFAAAGDRPNIIFIMADDLGYGDLGCYGQKLVKTPRVDRMAQEGLMFTQCYAGAVVCAPSRSVLMTGQHTGHTRVRNNKGQNTPPHDGQKGRIPLRLEDFTVAKLLQNAGYRTGITGKWGLGEPGSTGLPSRRSRSGSNTPARPTTTP